MSNRNATRLSPDLLLRAYVQGYFPMPDPDSNEIIWLRPRKRAILPLDSFHCSRSLRKTLNKNSFRVTTDLCFTQVMNGCANRPETWITDEFIVSYSAMFHQGFGHSVEVWQDNDLVGGVYGLSIGGAFFAESKFHTVRDASKVALFHLVEFLRKGGFVLLEVQFLTPHLSNLGAKEITDEQYQILLKSAIARNARF